MMKAHQVTFRRSQPVKHVATARVHRTRRTLVATWQWVKRASKTWTRLFSPPRGLIHPLQLAHLALLWFQTKGGKNTGCPEGASRHLDAFRILVHSCLPTFPFNLQLSFHRPKPPAQHCITPMPREAAARDLPSQLQRATPTLWATKSLPPTSTIRVPSVSRISLPWIPQEHWSLPPNAHPRDSRGPQLQGLTSTYRAAASRSMVRTSITFHCVDWVPPAADRLPAGHNSLTEQGGGVSTYCRNLCLSG